MVAIVHGFPSKSSALQFEAAWQHPQRDRRIKVKVPGLPVDSRRTVGVPGKLRLCKAMLCLDPWMRYGLGIRFLREEYAKSYDGLSLPPPLPPAGALDTERTTGEQGGLRMYASPLSDSQGMKWLEATGVPGACTMCKVCTEPFGAGEAVMSCHHCGTPAHVRCLAKRMLRDAGDESEVIPSEGVCLAPACGRRLLWSRLVKGVHTYRRALNAGDNVGGEADGSGAHCGAVDHAGSPLVWRVDDSGDDEDEDDDCGDVSDDDDDDDDDDADSDRESDHSARDTTSQPFKEENEDDFFWGLNSKIPDCSQRSAVDSVGGGDCVDISRCTQLLSVQKSLGSDPRKAKISERGGDASVIPSTKRRPDYLSSGGSDVGSEGLSDCSLPSPPKLSLVERLRLRRLDRTDN
eukprot:jgi/Undpi1/4241/HiC_scaffold_16.g07607.m1